MGEERLWEKSYPPGVRWDAPIEMAPLPGSVRCLHREVGAQGRARISRPHDQATPNCARRSSASPSGLMRSGRRARRRGRALSAQHALSPDHVLRRAQVRRAHRASVAARCGARAGLQAQGFRRARPGHDQHRLHGAAGAEAQSRRAGRSSDRRRRHGLRSVGHPDHADRSRCAGRALRRAARGRRAEAAARNGRAVQRRRHRAAAVHRRHHRQAQGRHAHPRQPQRRLLDLQGSGATRSASPRPARTRSSACCRCSTSTR